MKIETFGLCKKFGDTIILRNINLVLTPGIWGILGPNGAGKTTLIKMLSTVLRPSEGKILFDGKDVFSEPKKYLQNFGVLPQEIGFYPDFSVIDFLQFMSAAKEVPKSEEKARIQWVLNATNLFAESNYKIGQLSGGMKRRLGIAQAMLNDPKILILDEPTVGLDPEERVLFRKMLTMIAKDKIILLSTHIVQDVEAIADELLIMKSGEIVLCGSPSELLCQMEGRVWECVGIDDSPFIVSNIRHSKDGDTIYRIISNDPPCACAKQVAANLEDLYLYHFHNKYAEHITNVVLPSQRRGNM